MSGALEAYIAEKSGGLVSFEGVKPLPPKFLWDPYIRAANLNIVRGDGGAGKTMFVFALFTAITKGALSLGMPGVLECREPSNVIYFGSEDDPEDYRYRLDLCDCDPSRVFTVPARQMPTIAATDTIEKYIREVDAKLIVFDPIQAFLPAGVDMNSANDVRPLLDGLRAVCRKTGCTAIIIEHLNKASKMKAAYRGIGSVDFVNASRSVIMVGYHPEEPGKRVAMQIKANARRGQPIAFSISDHGVFKWEGVCDIEEDDLLNARQKKAPETADAVLLLVKKIVEANPDGWEGTAVQLEAQTAALAGTLYVEARTIGKRLPRLAKTLQAEGIAYRTKKTNGLTRHCFCAIDRG